MNNRDTLLHHLLPLVPFDGWSDYAFAEAAKRSGLDLAAAQNAFPGGASECMDYFFAVEDASLAGAFPAQALAKMRIPERI